jgi:hypothetical protein
MKDRINCGIKSNDIELTWIERSCEGDALLAFFNKSTDIRDIVGTGRAYCGIHCVRTCSRPTTTLGMIIQAVYDIITKKSDTTSPCRHEIGSLTPHTT